MGVTEVAKFNIGNSLYIIEILALIPLAIFNKVLQCSD